MQRGSNALYNHGEQNLKCGKGDQQGDKRVLERHAAPPALLQATEMFKAQKLTTAGVGQAGAPDRLVILLIAGPAACDVTGVTPRCGP
jgi:hypothetical protein